MYLFNISISSVVKNTDMITMLILIALKKKNCPDIQGKGEESLGVHIDSL